jgi:MraZ protein
MFLGQFYHNLDEKGRLTVPARYRDYLVPDGAYIMQGFDQNLMVLPSAKFEAFSVSINQMKMTDSIARLLKRMIFSTADQVNVDRAGRILIPQFLRQFADLDTSLVVVGMGDFFELWSTENWSKQNEILHDAQSNPDRFSALNPAIT